MYTVLVGLTCFVMFILAIGVFTPYDTTDRHTKKEILIKTIISLSFIARKDSPKLALVILIAGIAVPLIVWYLHISFPQPHLVPTPN